TMDMMDASSTYRIQASDHSIKGVETARKNIYRANDAANFTMKEKIAEMENFVCTLANNAEVEKSLEQRIKTETDPDEKKKLQAKIEYFRKLPMKNGLETLKNDREYALQERITARDLRIAHLGDRHFTMAEQQKKELQSLFDEDDIMRTQGQSSITSKMEDIAKRLQDKLDERDHIDEDTTPEEEIRDKEEQKNEELEKDKLEKEDLDKKDKTDESERNSSKNDTESVHTTGTFWKNAFDTMDWLNSVKKAKIMPDIAV
ncbi:MAG: hypothetical protein K2M91_04315, partial [Lachnospiraceae bacterium]|nr:hypothetical protein [Lachnospiraceae bacterium]